MTVQELYEYAKQCGVSDYEIRVQYRDDGGEYQGTDAFLYLLAEKEEKVLVLQEGYHDRIKTLPFLWG